MPRLIWVFAGRTVILFVLSWGGSIIVCQHTKSCKVIITSNRKSVTLFTSLFSWRRSTCEPPHDKTNKVACASSEDSDQPGHPPSLIRVFAVRSVGSKGPKVSWTVKTLIRLGGCPGWSESSLGAHATLLVLSRGGSCYIGLILAYKIARSWVWPLPYILEYSLSCKIFNCARFSVVLYRKFPNYSDTRNICRNHSKIELCGSTIE